MEMEANVIELSDKSGVLPPDPMTVCVRLQQRASPNQYCAVVGATVLAACISKPPSIKLTDTAGPKNSLIMQEALKGNLP